MCPATLDVDDFLGFVDRVEDTILVGEPERIAARKITEQLFAFIRTVDEDFSEDRSQLALQLR